MNRSSHRLAPFLFTALLGSCHSADPTTPPTELTTWRDPATGLTWQDPPFPERHAWSDGAAACAALEIDGVGGFRLPTIDELRTLARGCDATVSGGACEVTTLCLATSCGTEVCQGCTENGGPGFEGSYRLSVLTGDYMTSWTSSVPPDAPDQAWTVGFGGCHVLTYDKVQDNINTRCVR